MGTPSCAPLWSGLGGWCVFSAATRECVVRGLAYPRVAQSVGSRCTLQPTAQSVVLAAGTAPCDAGLVLIAREQIGCLSRYELVSLASALAFPPRRARPRSATI